MMSVDRAALIAVKPRAVATKGNQVADRWTAVLEIYVVSLHREVRGAEQIISLALKTARRFRNAAECQNRER